MVLSEGLLRTKNVQFFEHEGRHFLIFVARAAHNDPNKVTWAVFGFAQVNLILSRWNLSIWQALLRRTAGRGREEELDRTVNQRLQLKRWPT